MELLDREILALRHFEELSNGESPAVLGLTKTAANNRHIRALGRLRDLLERVPGFFERDEAGPGPTSAGHFPGSRGDARPQRSRHGATRSHGACTGPISTAGGPRRRAG